ncbi:TonB-dependent receptor [Novosphingobium flavum]|uniref:TonB-dependent receptor n=1 Tax=Novosphingobium flavum TaxID=1778672 RepID=A0A7X1KKB9_9SPHN|nr:TonB-dependent receptor [Novosphingobium flavum]MBC2664020.1 TonB-dependent receptor [Novosphingobium flavum]
MYRINSRKARLLAFAPITLSAAVLAHPALAAESEAEAPSVDELVVTAQREKANLQDTPISVTVLNDKMINQLNVHDVSDLRGLVPNLEVLPMGGGGAGVFGANQTSFAIRGVGSAQRFFNQDTKVGVYVDDVYLSSTYTMNANFFDIGNVQVLKGPQGTLFGKNTIGGAVLVDSHPVDETFGGYGRVTYGSYNRIEAQGAINVPLTENLGARVSFFTSDVDGYIKHLLDNRTSNDGHVRAVRGQLHYAPGAKVTFDFKAEYAKTHDNGNAFITTAINPNATYVKNYNSVFAPNPTGLTDGRLYQVKYQPLGLPYTIYGDNLSSFPYSPRPYPAMLPFNRGDNLTIQLRTQIDLTDALKVKLITGYKEINLDSYRGDGTPAGLYTEYNEFRTDQFSQEVQVFTHMFQERLKLTAGGYFIQQNANSEQITGPDYVDPVGYYYQNNNNFPSWAAYLQGTLKPTDKLSITAGVRYTEDMKNPRTRIWTSGCSGTFLSGYQNGTGGCWVPGPDGNTLSVANKTWHHIDPRFEIDYEWRPGLMTYVSYTSGYQSGGFNTQVGPGAPANVPYEQEIVRSWEGGIKSEWFDKRVRLNAAIFHQKYKNYQSSILVYYNGVDIRTTSSAANAHEWGYEAEFDARPIDALGLRANYAFLDQGYDEIFPGAQGLTLATAISSAPRHEWSVAGDYTVDLGVGKLVAAADYRWVGVKASGTAPLIAYTPSYGLLGANISFTPAKGNWSLSVYGKNLTKKYYYVAYSTTANGIGLATVTPGAPRTFGVTLGYKFN